LKVFARCFELIGQYGLKLLFWQRGMLELSSPLKKWQARLTQCWENRKEMIEESAKILCPISGRQSRPIKKSKGVRLCLWAFYWF
jgi:hypothetical protein